MPHFPVDRFLRAEELESLLQTFAQAHPDLIELRSLGQSFEGRPIWLIALTQRSNGPAAEKPGLWIDGNIHSTELAASTACLHYIESLVEGFRNGEETIVRALESRAFYVCPRVNPDGAELALADVPRFTRSSVRRHPYDEEPVEGFEVEDVDGDGRVLQMRIVDPNGGWKICEEEPRILVRRDPTEVGGTYYRVLQEGRLLDDDGVTIPDVIKREGLDLNRNFPADWKQEPTSQGAGPYPVSEPEVRAIVDFIARQRNLCGAITFHTFSGVLLRPYSFHPDEEMTPEDLWTFQKIGDVGERLTGYPAASCYHEFRYHPKSFTHGAFDDWIYDHLGLYAWTVEIWAPRREAGLTGYKFIEWHRDHPLEDDLQMLAWSDTSLSGRGYIDWYPFEHPQLGAVELGGWDSFNTLRNPPLDRLEKEVERFPEWLTYHALISPRLELHSTDVDALTQDTWRVRLVVHNTGWLPSYITKKALEKKAVRGVITEIELPEGCRLVSGKVRDENGQLEGRAYHGPVGYHDATSDRLKVVWVVQGERGSTVQLVARHDKAGVVRAQVTLD